MCVDKKQKYLNILYNLQFCPWCPFSSQLFVIAEDDWSVAGHPKTENPSGGECLMESKWLSPSGSWVNVTMEQNYQKNAVNKILIFPCWLSIIWKLFSKIMTVLKINTYCLVINNLWNCYLITALNYWTVTMNYSLSIVKYAVSTRNIQ